MKVRAISSVAAKLFYMTSALVILTIFGSTWQFSKTFISFQKDQVRNDILRQSEFSAGRIENEFERWKAQIATSLPTFNVGADDSKIPGIIEKLLAGNEDLVSLSIFGSDDSNSTEFKLIGEAFTPLVNGQRFEDKSPEKTWKIIQSLSTDFLKKNTPRLKSLNVSIDSIAKSTNLPLMMLGARFSVNDSKTSVFAVLTVWQTNIIKSLVGSSDTKFALVDQKGKIVSSTSLSDVISRRQFNGLSLLKTAMKANVPSGFQDEYRIEGKRKLGAFFKMPQYGFTILVQKDAERAYQAMQRNLVSNLLWSSLFLLVAVLFSYLSAKGITKSLRDVVYATSRIASGDFNYRIEPKSRDEIAHLGLSVNTMSAKILDLLSAQIKKVQFEKELETAKIVQETFFPEGAIKRNHLSAHGFYTPATECGGDLWGHFPIDDGIDFLFIADAMGHGAPAALVTAMAYATTMTVADFIADRSSFNDSPGKILDRLNRVIYEAVRGKISMTFFASVINTQKGTICYANAGHNFPLLIPSSQTDDRLGKKVKSREGALPLSLKLMGTPLGMDPKSIYKEQTLEIRPGDKLFYFTDGLIECASPDGKVWGRKYLVEQIAESWERSGLDLKDEIVKKAFQFFGNQPLADDVTIVVAELGKTWVKKENQEKDLPKIAANTNPAKSPETFVTEHHVQDPMTDTAIASANTPPSKPLASENQLESKVPKEPISPTPQKKYKINLPPTG